MKRFLKMQNKKEEEVKINKKLQEKANKCLNDLFDAYDEEETQLIDVKYIET